MRDDFYWTTLSAVGLTAGVSSALLLGTPVEKVVGMMLVTPILTALVGSILGTAQWFPLHRRVGVSIYSWVTATTLGLCAGLAAGVVLVEQTGRFLTGGRVHLLQLGIPARFLSFAVLGFVSGLLLGLAQQVALRRAPVAMRRWALASAIALAVGFSIASLLVDLVSGLVLASPTGLLLFLLTAGSLYGAITSHALRRAV